MSSLRRFTRADGGATAIEYALLVMWIGMVCLGGLAVVSTEWKVLGGKLAHAFAAAIAGGP